MEKFNNNVPAKTSEADALKYHEDLLKNRHASKYEYQPGSKEEQDFKDWERRYEEKNRKMEECKNNELKNSSGEEGQEVNIDDSVERVYDVIRIIDSLTLSPSFENDVEQIALLKEKKQQAKVLIKNLLQRDVVDYVSYVSESNRARVDVQNKEITSEDFAEVDKRRTIKHNTLIDSIRIVSRFIKNNFGVLSEDELDEYEESLDSRGDLYLEVNRVPLPKNVICPSYINTDIREEITDWALDISRSLAEINVRFSK